MIRIEITNGAGGQRTWNVEPLGDEVQLAAEERLLIEIPYSDDLLIEIPLRDDGASIYLPILPDDLKVNGTSIWK